MCIFELLSQVSDVAHGPLVQYFMPFLLFVCVRERERERERERSLYMHRNYRMQVSFMFVGYVKILWSYNLEIVYFDH